MKYHCACVLLGVFWLHFLETCTALAIIPICLTWNSTNMYLTVKCTVQIVRYPNDISIVDPNGNNRIQCTLEESPSCAGSHKYVLQQDFSENITTLLLKTEMKNADGDWKCKLGNTETTSYVFTEGSIPKPGIGISGEILKTRETSGFKLECFSCWEPYINSVDFYVNNVLEDSIRYQDGLCFHKNTLCNPEICTCVSEGKRFTWNFISDLTYIQFTCAMRFKEKLTSKIFIHQANLIYNGSVFIQKQTSNESINYADKNPDNTFENKAKTHISEYIGYSVPGIIGLIISMILVICCLKIIKKKNEKESPLSFAENNKETKSRDESIPLQAKQINEDFLRCAKKENVMLSVRNIFNTVLKETNLNELAIRPVASDHLKQFGFEVLKGWGVEVEEDRVSFHMHLLQSLYARHHIFLHDVAACLFRDISLRFLRLYDVKNFDLNNLDLPKDMYNELNKVFKMIIDMNGGKGWYHYRRNGLTYERSRGGAFSPFKQDFLNKKSSSIFQQFSSYESRFGTFHDYPIEMISYRKKLAQAGFFYFHVSDYVQCYNCGGCLRDWKDLLGPLERHIETFPTCKFAMDIKRQRGSLLDVGPVEYVGQQTHENRLNSFKSFPATLSKDDIRQLAYAGFSYCGIATDIECCACYIEFSDIENTEYILRQHKQSSPECPFINISVDQAKRKDMIDQKSISFMQYVELQYISHDYRFLNIFDQKE